MGRLGKNKNKLIKILWPRGLWFLIVFSRFKVQNHNKPEKTHKKLENS